MITTMKIKDLPGDPCLGGLAFKHPQTGETCYWKSQWGYEGGGAGIFYAKKPGDTRVFVMGLNKLTDALEFELVEEKPV